MKTYNTITCNVAPWTNFIGYLTIECDIIVFFFLSNYMTGEEKICMTLHSIFLVFPKDLLNIKELSQYGSFVIMFGNLRKLLTIQ